MPRLRRAPRLAPVAVGLAFALACPLQAQLSGSGLATLQSGDLQHGGVAPLLLGTTMVAGDFDGDGLDDLVIGSPFAAVAGQGLAGAVHVLPGRSGDFVRRSANDSVPTLVLHQDVAGIGDVAESGDQLGMVLAVGDFNADGYDDLAIASTEERIVAAISAGVVHVIPGSTSGLDPAGEVTLHAGLVGGAYEERARFGFALETGDFDDDGYDDLVVGAPGTSVNDRHGAGAVFVVPGSQQLLDTGAAQQIDQLAIGLALGTDSPFIDDAFGAGLAAGDFDGDGYDDLAIGSPGEWTEPQLGTEAVGRIHVLRGSVLGLLVESASGVLNPFPQEESRFGETLAAGDIDGDGRDDLVVSVPGYDHTVPPTRNAGILFLFSERDDRDLLETPQWFDRSVVHTAPEVGDRAGYRLQVADVDDDGHADVLMALVGGIEEGYLGIVHGTSTGLGQGETYGRGLAGLGGPPGHDDYFAHGFALGRFDGSRLVLAVGTPGEQDAGGALVGVVQFLARSVELLRDGFESGDTSAWN